MCFTPQETPFPNDAPGDMPAPSDLINERELREILASDLPVADLLQWLHKRHPDLQDVTLLRLYHTLIHEDQHWTAYQSDRQQERTWKPNFHPEPSTSLLPEIANAALTTMRHTIFCSRPPATKSVGQALTDSIWISLGKHSKAVREPSQYTQATPGKQTALYGWWRTRPCLFGWIGSQKARKHPSACIKASCMVFF